MANFNPLSAFWLSLCITVAVFYLYRLVFFLARTRRFDAESDIGHGLMAVGMAIMLAPLKFLTAETIRWNIFLFTLVALWFAGRLLARRPLLAILRGSGGRSQWQADAIHVLTSLGMICMFLETGNMALSMTQLAIYLNCAFFTAFAYLLLTYTRDISKDLQKIARVDWLKLGADLAHVLMNGVMGWMFIEMITMGMRMQGV